MISHSDRYLPWLSFPATAAWRSVLLPSSAVLPNRRRIVPIISWGIVPTWRVNSVTHSPGLTKLIVTPVSEAGRIEASSLTAYNKISLEVGYLRPWSACMSHFTLPQNINLPFAVDASAQPPKYISIYLLKHSLGLERHGAAHHHEVWRIVKLLGTLLQLWQD